MEKASGRGFLKVLQVHTEMKVNCLQLTAGSQKLCILPEWEQAGWGVPLTHVGPQKGQQGVRLPG